MTQPEEAMHTEREDEPKDQPLDEARDQHLGSENPNRSPVKSSNDPSHVDLPATDLDRPTEAAADHTRRDMH